MFTSDSANIFSRSLANMLISSLASIFSGALDTNMFTNASPNIFKSD